MRPGDLTCILSNAFFVCKDGVDKNKMKKNMREPFDGGVERNHPRRSSLRASDRAPQQ